MELLGGSSEPPVPTALGLALLDLREVQASLRIMASLVEALKSELKDIEKFNNSETLTLVYRYKVSGALFGTRTYFPCKASDMEIANALKSILTVPFALAVAREG